MRADMKRIPNKLVTRQHGLAATEFAVILPVMLLLMLGTAELGRAFYLNNALTKAARDGARYLATNAIDGTTGVIDITTEVETTTKNLVIYGDPKTGTPLLENFTPADITITPFDAVHVQLSAVYNFTPLFSRIPTFGLGSGDIQLNYPLRTSITMRALR
jgi:hypothetical protein